MNTESIITIFLAGAAWLQEPAHAIASQALRDLYAATKYYLKRKFAQHPAATHALELAAEKPASAARKAMLVEEAEPAELAADSEVRSLIERMAALLPANAATARGSVHVAGNGNQVNLAGHDVIVTARHVHRNAITPDERHVAHVERARLRELIHALAGRLEKAGNGPNFAAVHRLLQHRFDVASYLLIPRERYAEAIGFLQQQCAAHRAGLRRRDTVTFRRELLRAIFGRTASLRWSRAKMLQFAQEKLGLSEAVTSLGPLSGEQLETLLARLRRVPDSPVAA